MKSSQVVFLLILFLLTGLNTVSAQVSIDPVGVAVSAEEGDSIVVEVTLTNDSDNNIFFSLDFDKPPDEDEENAGPRRDPGDPGELIAEFDGNNVQNDYSSCIGWDYDNEWMWVSVYSAGNAVAWSHDNDYENFEQELRIAPGNCMDGCWANGLLFLGPWSNASVNRYDNEGDNVGAINFGHAVYGIAADIEEQWFLVLSSDNTIYVYEIDEDNEIGDRIGAISNHMGYHGNSNCYGLDWVPAHPDAPLWMTSGANNRAYNIAVDRDGDDWECIDSDDTVDFGIGGNGQQYCSVAHDGEYIWASGYTASNIRIYEDGVAEINWLVADLEDEEGEIEANGSTSFNLIFQPIEMEDGVYEIYMIVELYEDEERDVMSDYLMISAIMSYNSSTANVYGEILSAEDGAPIENAKLEITGQYLTRFTNEDGEFSFDNVPLRDYEITISATDFLTTVEDVSVNEEGEFEWNIDLYHSECNPSQNRFIQQLEPEMSYNFDFTIENGGNGPLAYTVDRRLLGDANAEPFDLRQTDEIEGDLEDNFLAGAVFADEHFYISGGNNGNNPNKIYILNMEREIVDEFDQFTDDRYGMRDLTYDGALI
ncbi:MAG: carboxypeptidase regulatory-like domain-containing protein, partial [Calditrichaeota bacterium]|nr:carboxypeptidase regulatory-like domain-containing protein [Calditrichota bacterium]